MVIRRDLDQDAEREPTGVSREAAGHDPGNDARDAAPGTRLRVDRTRYTYEQYE